MQRRCKCGGCTLNPPVGSAANREFEAQTVVIVAKIVHAADHDHGSQQGFLVLSEVSAAYASRKGYT